MNKHLHKTSSIKREDKIECRTVALDCAVNVVEANKASTGWTCWLSFMLFKGKINSGVLLHHVTWTLTAPVLKWYFLTLLLFALVFFIKLWCMKWFSPTIRFNANLASVVAVTHFPHISQAVKKDCYSFTIGRLSAPPPPPPPARLPVFIRCEQLSDKASTQTLRHTHWQLPVFTHDLWWSAACQHLRTILTQQTCVDFKSCFFLGLICTS